MAWTTPPTFTVNEVLTSGAMNGITGDLAYLYGDTTWSPLTLVGSWASSVTPGYRRVGNLVVMRGAVTGGSSGNQICTLAAGYRPTQAVSATTSNGYGGGPYAVVVLTISTAGAVVPYYSAGAAPVGLDGIFFSLI